MSQRTSTSRPFDALRRELEGPSESDAPVTSGANDDIRVDAGREGRTGIPEVVLAETKTLDQVVDGLARLARLRGRAIASRCTPAMLSGLPDLLRDRAGLDSIVVAEASAVVAIDPVHQGARVELHRRHDWRHYRGDVGYTCRGGGGTDRGGDGPRGRPRPRCRRRRNPSVGAALGALMERRPGAIIVAAGMDGALPSVVAGLVDVPVIGLPTSVGYGLGRAGRSGTDGDAAIVLTRSGRGQHRQWGGSGCSGGQDRKLERPHGPRLAPVRVKPS